MSFPIRAFELFIDIWSSNKSKRHQFWTKATKAKRRQATEILSDFWSGLADVRDSLCLRVLFFPLREAIFGSSSQVSHQTPSFSVSSSDLFLLFSVHYLDTYFLHIKYWWLLYWRLFLQCKTCFMVTFLNTWICNGGCICRWGETEKIHRWLLVRHKPLKIEAQKGVLLIYFLAVLRTKILSCQKWYQWFDLILTSYGKDQS